MFGTLRYDAQNDDTHFIERTTDPLNGKGEGQRPRYSACDKCRAKKQRCGGRRDGCERCIRTASECVYSLQGKGRGRRRRNGTEGDSSVDSAKRSKPEKAQPLPTPPKVDMTPKMDTDPNDSMSTFLPVDAMDSDFPTSGLMQSDLLPGFDGQSIDDYLDSNYMSTLPGQDFDPGFYFPNHSQSLDSTPIDSLSEISSIFEPAQLMPSRSDFGMDSNICLSPMSSVRTFSDGLPSPLATPQARPGTPTTSTSRPRKGSPSAVISENCQCLSTMVVLLEDLETKSRSVDTAALDSILVSQKEALGRCNTVLNCPSCFLRPEYIMLLGMVTERLASLCESTVAKYLDDVQHDGSSSFSDFNHNYHNQHGRGNPMDGVKVSLGGYEIETPDERVGMVRLLIVMQLQSLRKFVEGVANAVASRKEGKTQVAKVQAAEQRLARLIQKIRQSKA